LDEYEKDVCIIFISYFWVLITFLILFW
jgi:hypothetical protein